jgi:hypothetical protein
VTDVSPRINSPERPRELPPEDADKLLAAASALQQAVGDLAREIASGGRIQTHEARNRFEFALSDFSSLIERPAD